jgi:hypothetical protein
MRWGALIFAALSGTALAAQPGAAQPSRADRPARTCNFDAYSNDPSGQAVHAAPSADARVVGRLTAYGRHYPAADEIETGASFDVIAARNGWFYIINVERPIDEAGPDESGRVRDPIEGWIRGAGIAFEIQSEKGFTRPNRRARLVWSSREGFSHRSRLLDCSGEWAQISWTNRGRAATGWFRGICGSQWTTCDGAGGDFLNGTSQSRSMIVRD